MLSVAIPSICSPYAAQRKFAQNQAPSSTPTKYVATMQPPVMPLTKLRVL